MTPTSATRAPSTTPTTTPSDVPTTNTPTEGPTGAHSTHKCTQHAAHSSQHTACSTKHIARQTHMHPRKSACSDRCSHDQHSYWYSPGGMIGLNDRSPWHVVDGQQSSTIFSFLRLHVVVVVVVRHADQGATVDCPMLTQHALIHKPRTHIHYINYTRICRNTHE